MLSTKSDKTKAIILDLDATLTDPSHRLHYIQDPRGKDWDSFYAAGIHDPINMSCVELLKDCLRINPNAEILVLTGRVESNRDMTVEYLKKFKSNVWNEFEYTNLWMRGERDFRPSYVYKEDVLLNKILPFYEVIEALDDCPKIIKMYESHGINAHHFVELHEVTSLFSKQEYEQE